MSEDKITYSQLHIGRDISYDRLKAKCGNLKNFDLIFKFFDDITPAKSGKIGYNEMDQVLNVMNDKGLFDPEYLEDLDKMDLSKPLNIDLSNPKPPKEYYVDDEEVEQFLKANDKLSGVSVDEMQTFFKALAQSDDEVWDEEWNSNVGDIDKRYANVPEEVRKIAHGQKDVKITKHQKGYVISHSDPDMRMIVAPNGTILASEGDGCTENRLGACRETEYYYEDGTPSKNGIWFGEYASSRKYTDSGAYDYENYDTNEMYRQMGRTRFNYKYDKDYNKICTDIKLNEGLPNEAKLEFELDENGKIKDIKVKNPDKNDLPKDVSPKTIDSPIKLSESEKQKLIDFINSGKQFAEDFDLSVENNQVKIRAALSNRAKVSAPPVPDNITDEIFRLQEQGLLNNQDFKLSYTNDGKFELKLKTKNALYDKTADFQTVEYSADGKTKTTTTYKGDDVVKSTEAAGQKMESISKREDEFLEALLTQNWQKANDLLGLVSDPGGDFGFYAACQKYQDITGKNLMSELLKLKKAGQLGESLIARLTPMVDRLALTLLNQTEQINADEHIQKSFDKHMNMYNEIAKFDPKTSQIGHLLPEIQRTQISENEYEEKIDGKTYHIKVENNQMFVTKDGKTFKIDLTGVNDFNKSLLTQFNSKVLYRIASTDIKIQWGETFLQDQKRDENAGIVIINPNDNNIAGYYEPETNSMKIFPKRFSRSFLLKTVAHETGHSLFDALKEHNEELENAFKEEYDAWQASDEPFKTGQHTYCVTSLDEMIAECYALAVTGNSDGAYTICKHFPKTFAIIKRLIDEREK